MLFLVAVKALSRVVLGVVALGVVAGCGGGNPLKVADGGSAGRVGAGQDGGGGSAPDCGPDGQTVTLPDCSDCKGGYRPFVRCSDPGGLLACPPCPAPTSCHGLDEARCAATSGCQAGHCPLCKGGQTFAGCLSLTEHLPSCLAPCLRAPCSELDETSCGSRSDCTVLSCPDCMGGQTFAGCAAPGGAGAGCGPCPPTCSAFDETSCKANSYCHPGYCADCNGGQKFTTCLGPNEHVACPKSACPAIPAPCAKLDEATCKGRGDCQAEYCNGCKGRTFAGCGDPGAGFTCPADPPVCPPVPCANIADQLSCDARTDCHSVFDNWHCPGTAAVCPVVFTGCSDGGKASCKAPSAPILFCAAEPPPCEASGYVISYLPTCYEGCVRAGECAP